MVFIFVTIVIVIWIAITAALNIVFFRNLFISSLIAGGVATIFMAIGLSEHMGRMWSLEYLRSASLMLLVYSAYALVIGFVSKLLFRLFTDRLKKRADFT